MKRKQKKKLIKLINNQKDQEVNISQNLKISDMQPKIGI